MVGTLNKIFKRWLLGTCEWISAGREDLTRDTFLPLSPSEKE